MGSAIQYYSGLRLVPLFPDRANRIDVAMGPNLNVSRGTVLAQKGNINDVQTVTINATGGTFTLTDTANVTAALAFNASSATVQAALAALPSIGVGNIEVSGAAGGPYVCTRIGALAGAPSTLMTAQAGALTGGAGTATPVHTTVGVVAGKFYPYANGATDGTQIASLLAEYDFQTDASGNLTYSSTSGQVGNEFGAQDELTPAFYCGIFRTGDLVGLDPNAVSVLMGRVIRGSLANGVFHLP